MSPVAGMCLECEKGAVVENGKPVVVFGAGSFAALMTRYIERFTDWSVAAYTVDRPYCGGAEFNGRPLVPFDELGPADAERWDALLAVGYSQSGDVRRRAFGALKGAGFTVRNFVHPTCQYYGDEMGEGNLLLESTVVGFGARLGHANLLWTGANVGHDDEIGSFCTLCATASFGGFTTVGDNCFFGLNATVRDHIHVAPYTLVGAGASLTHDSSEGDVYVARGTEKASPEKARRIRKNL